MVEAFLAFFISLFFSPPTQTVPDRAIFVSPVAPTHTLTPRPTPIPTKIPTPTPLPLTNSLVTQVNSYRKLGNRSSLIVSPLLCTIAQKRTSDLQIHGSLDHHVGIKKYEGEIFTQMNTWHEVIYWSSNSRSPKEIVYEGWNNSASHKESLLTPDATHGCGSIKAGYAVFLLGKKK